jgi:hypothetical protein
MLQEIGRWFISGLLRQRNLPEWLRDYSQRRGTTHVKLSCSL